MSALNISAIIATTTSGSGITSTAMAEAMADDAECPECLYFEVDIDRAVPLEYALPLYGFLMPVLVLFTTAINSFCMLVLWQRHLRTPTNFVLLSMALADLLTGLSSVPWFLFYYTLRGYELRERDEGLPAFWCRVQPLLSQIVPTIWHTSAIWLGVFLAVQRYIYVCVPSQVHRFCTPDRTRKAVAAIVLCSVLTEMPELFGKWMERVRVGPERNLCLLRYSAWVRHGLGVDLFFSLHYWFRVALVHALPCLLLLVFTLALTRTIRQAQLRRRSWTTTIATNGVAAAGGAAVGPSNDDDGREEEEEEAEQLEQQQQSPDRCSPSQPPRLLSPAQPEAIAGGGPPSSSLLKKSASWGGGIREPSAAAPPNGGGRSLDSTNRMLAAICSVFLLIELPAAFIFTLHLLIATGIVSNTANTYRVLNVTLIIRNLLIVFTSPLQFGIYCSMSEQFRLTVRQLFSSRPLFVAQAQPSNYHGGKRYSLILVDVELIRRQQQQVHNQQQTHPAAATTAIEEACCYPRAAINRRRHLSLQVRRCPPQKGNNSSSSNSRSSTAGGGGGRPAVHRKRSAPTGQQQQQGHKCKQQQVEEEAEGEGKGHRKGTADSARVPLVVLVVDEQEEEEDEKTNSGKGDEKQRRNCGGGPTGGGKLSLGCQQPSTAAVHRLISVHDN